MSERSEYTFLQRRYTNGQQPHERCSLSLAMREIQNQNHNHTLFQTHWDEYNPKD
jgi:hypothetical protein